MMTLKELEDAIKRKENLVELLKGEISILQTNRAKAEDDIQNDHFENPEPGDFWHDCYSPVLIVLENLKDELVICDKTKDVYDPPHTDMVLKSYENPENPEVKRYFSIKREPSGYTFDLEQARTISRSEFDDMLKCYSENSKLTYRCIPGRAKTLVEIWNKR